MHILHRANLNRVSACPRDSVSSSDNFCLSLPVRVSPQPPSLSPIESYLTRVLPSELSYRIYRWAGGLTALRRVTRALRECFESEACWYYMYMNEFSMTNISAAQNGGSSCQEHSQFNRDLLLPAIVIPSLTV